MVSLLILTCNVQRRSVCQLKILGKMAFYALSDQFFRASCCGVQMATATSYTETSQLSLFDFFDTFSCECGAAHLAYLNLREQ